MPTPLVMDVDTGIDDALAVMLAVRSPELDLVGVCTVAGNVDPRTAARNTLHVLDTLGATHVPVAVGASAPLLQPWRSAEWVHGADGMGDSALPEPGRRPQDEDAVAQLLRLSHEHAGRLVVAAVGPLTNLALALRLDPHLASRLDRIVLMGGSARVGGNLAPWAEYNIAVDPEAAAIVFDAPVARTMVGLDVTMQTRIDDGDVARFAACADPAGTLAAAILPHYLDVYERTTGTRRAAMHDALAVAVVARPELVVTRELPVQVETASGLTRGMTVVDLRGPRAEQEGVGLPRTDVALEVDVEAFLELFLTRLTERGGS